MLFPFRGVPILSAVLLTAALTLPTPQDTVLYGTVHVASRDEPVANALVELPALTRKTMTDSVGWYQIDGIPPGTHMIRITRLGYESRTLEIIVPVSRGLRLDVGLRSQPVVQPPVSVSFRGQRPFAAHPPDERDPHLDVRVVDRQDAVRNSTLGGADFFSALGSLPDVWFEPESPTSLRVRGGAADQNLVTLDGAPLFSPYHYTESLQALNPDAVEFVRLHESPASADRGGALAGYLDILTTAPGSDRLQTIGAISARSARATVATPVPLGSSTILGSARRIGHMPFAQQTSTDLEATDLLVKSESRLAGGSLEALVFRTSDAVRFSAVADTSPEDLRLEEPAPGPDTDSSPNDFRSQAATSFLSWRSAPSDSLRFEASIWHASLKADGSWHATDPGLQVMNRRVSDGVSGLVNRASGKSGWKLGFRAERERIRYAVVQPSLSGGGKASYVSASDLTVLALFGEKRASIADRSELSMGLRGTLGTESSTPLLEPRVSSRLRLGGPWTAFGGYGRTHQWVQSLRNPESLVDRLFGADLSTASGVPVASSDEVTAGLDFARDQVLVRLLAYHRWMENLVLVAPGTEAPFAAGTGEFEIGRGRSSGIGLLARLDRRRSHLRLGYAWSTNSRSVTNLSYRPSGAGSHSVVAVVGYEPYPDLHLTLDVIGATGRTATVAEGPVDWETCGVSDGCDIAGSPRAPDDFLQAPGSLSYLRIDLGARRSWRLSLLGGETSLAGYVKVSNILNRRNVLGFVEESSSDHLRTLLMRSRSLLDAGLEWRR